MAKTIKKLDFDKINWAKTIKNFSRLKKENKLGLLSTIPGAIKNENILSVSKVNPDWPGWRPIIVIDHIIIVVVRGPKPRPGIGPYVRETFDAVLNAKDVNFNRFSKDGIQHMIVTSGKGQLEIMAVPELK
jgi:hypothetical protein